MNHNHPYLKQVPLNFTECRERAKRRKTAELKSTESLLFAARIKFQEAGNVDKAKLLAEMGKFYTLLK